MILQTMTPEEKVRECEKMIRPLLEAATGWARKHHAVFKTKTFPAIYSFEHDFTCMGRWVVLVIVESRNNLRKGILCVKAYQTFHVSRARDVRNIGLGIWMIDANDNGVVSCHEFPPHYFTRVRERLVAPKGIVQPTFPQLVKIVVREHFDSMDETVKFYTWQKDEKGKYAVVQNNEISRRDGYDNLVTYHKNGISLGLSSANRRYFLFSTFVDNSLLYENQLREQKKRLRELLPYLHAQKNNPFGTSYEKSEWRSAEDYRCKPNIISGKLTKPNVNT